MRPCQSARIGWRPEAMTPSQCCAPSTFQRNVAQSPAMSGEAAAAIAAAFTRWDETATEIANPES